MSDEKTVSRRKFLGVGGAALLGGAVLAKAPLSAAPAPRTDPSGLPRKWDEASDVIIVGTGFAGLAAAIEARRAGAEVLVIDKMRTHGGNSIINGGEMAAPGNRYQKEAGIQDSAELLMKDMLKAGAYLNHPDLVRICAEKSTEVLDWCESVAGAKFVKLVFHGGHSVKRSVQTDNASGAGLVNPMMAKAKSMGVKFMMTTKMERLVTNREGRVVGMEVRKGYKFPDDQSGKVAFLKARRAVVLASGGFSQNLELRQIHDPRIDARFDSTNHPGATGEATLAACKIGAMDVQMDWIQMGPWTSPDEKGFGQVPQFCERLVGYGLMVDPKTGKRFIQETGNRKVRADAMMALNHPVIIFSDSVNVNRQVLPHTLAKGMENGAIKKFDTIEDLAKAYQVPLDVLKAEIAKWNGFVEKRTDSDFNCKIFPETTPVAVAPFYASRLWPRVHYCMGGLVANKDAQVKNFDLKPIPSLYVAGEAMGAVHGAVRLGTCSMLGCVVFGRIAGQNAAQQNPWG